MKQNRILGLIWLLVAVVLCYIMVVSMGKVKFTQLPFISINKHGISSSAGLSDTMNFSIGEIENIEMDLMSESVQLEITNDSKISVELYCDDNVKPTVKVEKKVLKIESKKSKSIFSFGNRRVVVKIPASANIDNLDIGCLSGYINLNGLEAEGIDCRSTSGSVTAEACKADSIDLQSQSGTVKIINCESKELDGKSTSGSVNVTGAFSQVDLHSTSGSVRAELHRQLDGDSEISSVSGSVHLVMPRKSNMEIKYSTGSGSYKNELTGTSGKRGTDVVGSNGPKVVLSTTSGSIRVE